MIPDKRKARLAEYIEKCKKVHNLIYDYSLVESDILICDKHSIICPVHGVFKQSIKNHARGEGCPTCALKIKHDKMRHSKERFVESAIKKHGVKFNYDKFSYTHSKAESIIVCPIHGEFLQSPSRHYQYGCPKCGIEQRASSQTHTTESFINKSNRVHNYKFSYEKSVYISGTDPITIKCPTHGYFDQMPESHLRGNGCPVCRASKGELKIKSILDKSNILYKIQQSFNDCRHKLPLPFDFYLPDTNTCIEYDGRQHFCSQSNFGSKTISGEENLKCVQRNDSIKNNYCLENGIRLIRIRYDEDIDTRLKEEGIIL